MYYASQNWPFKLAAAGFFHVSVVPLAVRPAREAACYKGEK